MFGIGAWPAQAAWRDARSDAGVSSKVAFKHPLTNEIADTSVTIFADDAGSCIAAPSLEELHWLDGMDDKIFNNAHLAVGLTQNLEKAVRTVKLNGVGAYRLAQAIRNADGKVGRFTVSPCARYLGPYLTPDGSFNTECDRRIQVVNNNWITWRAFWGSRASQWIKKLVFHGIIFQALTSAVAAFVLSPAHYRKLTTTFCRKARSVLQGGACHKDNGKHNALSNVQVLEVLGYAPIAVEIAIIRLKFWANIFSNPEHHKLIIASMFGKSINTNELALHPHLVQLKTDMDYLVFVEDLAEYRHEIAANPLVLLSDPHLNLQFVKANFGAIRVAFLSTCIAPPPCCDTVPSGRRVRAPSLAHDVDALIAEPDAGDAAYDGRHDREPPVPHDGSAPSVDLGAGCDPPGVLPYAPLEKT
jgi:hypothetical protein